MKPSTRRAYAIRVDAVLARLQSALGRGEALPGLDELASVAHLSSFHFHRVWRALTGEPLGRTIARLRLARALHLLEDPAATVTGVALACGYDSAQSLARACREALGTTPAGLRGDRVRIAQAREHLQPPQSEEAPAALQVEVVSLEPLELVALRRRGAFAELDGGYGALFAWAAEEGLVESITSLHGVPLGDHRELRADHFEFDCAIAIACRAPAPAPLRALTIAGGLHARVRHVGPYEGIEDLVDAVLAHWWPTSGHGLREAPVHYRFLDDPEIVPAAMLRADIYLPLEALQPRASASAVALAP